MARKGRHNSIWNEWFSNLLAALSSCSSPIFAGFVFVASADVLEYFPANFTMSISNAKLASAELLLVAHQSGLDVATQHGVFVTDNNGGGRELLRVLQKPSVAQLGQSSGAIFEDQNSLEMAALTDSCYLLRPELVEQFLRLRKENGEIHCELCCYRDFLGPLGKAPDEEKKSHFVHNEPNLLKWQQTIWDLMKDRRAELLELGPDSFFHFGTAGEFLHHFLEPNSAFRQKFLAQAETTNLVCSRVKNVKNISPRSFLECCEIESEKCQVGDGCILSGIRIEGEGEGHDLAISAGMCLCTLPIGRPAGDGAQNGMPTRISYVTVLFHREDDLKRVAGTGTGALNWFGHPISPAFKCLWECPLFRAQNSKFASLASTLEAVENGPSPDNSSLLSISEALAMANVRELLQQREALKRSLK